jgi:hypothetical protein
VAEQQVRPEPGPDTGILVTIRSLLPNLAPVERLFVTLAQQDLPGTRVALERTFAAAQAKRVRRTRRQQAGDP